MVVERWCPIGFIMCPNTWGMDFMANPPTVACRQQTVPDSKVHGANIGPIWGRQDPGGPHVGPMIFAIFGCYAYDQISFQRISEPISTLYKDDNSRYRDSYIKKQCPSDLHRRKWHDRVIARELWRISEICERVTPVPKQIETSHLNNSWEEIYVIKSKRLVLSNLMKSHFIANWERDG